MTGIIPDIKELLALRYYANSIRLFNDQKVATSSAGGHLSLIRGRGMDFEEVRRYQPGDDIRLIHWSLTARMGKPYTKIYREERERAVYLLIDQSTSMQFGTRVSFKNVLAAKLAALIGWAALKQHEQIGGIVFNNHAAEFIKPRRSNKTLMNIFNLLANQKLLQHYKGGLNNNLNVLLQNLQTGSIVILISDYSEMDENTKTYLRLIGQKCEVINLFTYDPLEMSLPTTDKRTFSFTNDTKLQLQITNSKKNNALYSAPFAHRLEIAESFALKNRMPFVKLATNDNLVVQLNRGVMNRG